MAGDIISIERMAYDLGFSGFGIVGPDNQDAVERYQQWLDLGYEGEMAYMSRWIEKRSDLDKVLPGVKSVLCLSKNYLTADKDMYFLEKKNEGDISLYALNEDYHDLLLPGLKQLEKKIHEEFIGCRTKIYTDTGPVLEKPLAQKAGIGWLGKHSNLLTEQCGSWYFLSEILVDVSLPVSEEATDHCGTCTACIDICPTRAIVAPYVLDARKCISYLTIELKGMIPLEFRKAMGNHIFGCDDCQIVCPWNSYAVKTNEAGFCEREETRTLIELMKLDEEGFRKRFRKSPVKRIKRRGLLRNVAVALGNSENLEAVPVLVEALSDPEPLIRAHSVWGLGELLGDEASPVVDRELSLERDPLVLKEIDRVLGSAKLPDDPEAENSF